MPQQGECGEGGECGECGKCRECVECGEDGEIKTPSAATRKSEVRSQKSEVLIGKAFRIL
ncbi:MAG: hypothetical protein F6K48_29645 [Okeania sp. SIO3H1]|nr:hypothetical protein [Okeania sp. SIO3H1]